MKDSDPITTIHLSIRAENCLVLNFKPDLTIGELRAMIKTHPESLLDRRSMGIITFNELCRAVGLPDLQREKLTRSPTQPLICPRCGYAIKLVVYGR